MDFKFRAWYKGDNPKIKFEMKLIEDDSIWFESEEFDIRYPFHIPFVDTDFIVELYSPFFDIDGHQICQGDLVTHPDFSIGTVLEVEYQDGCFCISGWDCIKTDLSKCKIIGNKWQYKG